MHRAQAAAGSLTAIDRGGARPCGADAPHAPPAPCSPHTRGNPATTACDISLHLRRKTFYLFVAISVREDIFDGMI
ncbi:unnamed protein product, partial [Iphiclides podalirius]